MSALDSILNQYEKNNSNSSAAKSGKSFDLKNYFNTMLKDGVNTATKRIRILPNNGKSPFVELMGHKTQVEGEWKTFACLKHEEGTDCPFCEAREVLLSTGKEADKELAKKYSAKKMYVVKIIDRGFEEEGVKFWRFNHDYRKTGTFDKIAGVIQALNQDISDANTGRDLIINIGRDQNKRAIITSIVHADPSPLSTDAEKAAEWVGDSRTWRDVYSLRTYDYLRIIVKGGVPAWDKVNEKWADKNSIKAVEKANEADDLDAELSMGAKTATATKATPAATDTVEDDDLPF